MAHFRVNADGFRHLHTGAQVNFVFLKVALVKFSRHQVTNMFGRNIRIFVHMKKESVWAEYTVTRLVVTPNDELLVWREWNSSSSLRLSV